MNQNYNFVRSLFLQETNARNEEFATKKGSSFKSLLLLAVFALFASISMQGQTTLISPTGDGGFENGTTFAANGWSVANSVNNPWIVGSAITTAPFSGRSAYISNDGVTNAYTDSNSSSNFFYRDVTVPAGQTKIILTFNWSCQGETSFDNWQVFYAPTTVTPVGATAYPGSGTTNVPSGIAGATFVGFGQMTAGIQTATFTLPATLAGTTFRIIFSWKNDSASTQPPAGIDNISLISRVPIPADAAPTLFTSTLVTFTGATIGWTDSSTNETAFRLYRSTDNVNFTQIGADITSTTTIGTGNTYSSVQTSLIPGITYYYRIASVYDVESSFLIGTQATLPPGSITSIASGNWSQTTTWSSGTIPTATDNVIIADGHTVNIDLVAPTCLDLTIGQGASGVLTFTSTLVATLTVNGSITVATGGNFNAGSSATIVHNIFLGGGIATSPYASNLTVNGTFDMWLTATTGRATLTFFGIQNSVISGAGTLDLNNTNIINKGATTATALVTPPVLELQRAFTVQGANTLGFVTTLTAGTLKIGGTFTQSNPVFTATSYSVPALGGIWLNNPNFTVAGLAGSPTVTGLFRVTTGTYNIGTSSGNSLGSGTNSVYIIEGGAINAAGRFNLTSVGVYYNQSGGIVSVATVANATASSASFGITSTTASFIMSGGTIVLVQRNSATLATTTRDYFNVGTPTITGGTLQVGTAATATNFNFRLNGNAPNIEINNTTNNKKVEVFQTSGVLNILGTLTVNLGTTFDCLGMSAFARGNVVNNGIIQGLVTGSRFDFSGTTPQTYSGTGTFGTALAPFIGTGVGIANYTNVTLNSPIVTTRTNLFGGTFINSNQITLGNAGASTGFVQRGGSTAAAGTFDVAPTFNIGTGGLTVNYNTSTVNTSSGLEIPTSRLVSSFIVNNANGVTLSGGALSSTALTLTLGNLTTTSTNLLTVTGTTTASITGGSATTFVNGPIARTLPASLVTGSNYSFPVGKTTYNPFVLVNPTTNAGGTVTVQSEVVEANTGGTAGTLMGTLNTNKYWASLITAGATNFTDSLIQLNDTPNGADAIAASATLTGAYNIVGGVAITSTATSLTSTAPASTSLPGFYVMGNKAAATLTNLVITPTGDQCSIVSRTVSVTATPGGGAVTGVVINYSVNGTAQTAIPMTNTSGNVWSAVIPTVTPINGSVTWSVTATDANLLTKTAIGTPYSDESLLGVNATSNATVTSLCAGNNSVLTAVGSTPGVRSLGLGASTSSTAGASMFSGSFGGHKSQYIIRASELAAAGIAAGNISSLAFEATTAFNGYEGFALNIGHTDLTVASFPMVSTGLTQVYSGTGTNGAYATTVGVNTLTFSAPFAWNGFSNIVVSFCWSKNPIATFTTGTSVRVDNPGFVCTMSGQKDSVLPGVLCPLVTTAEFGTSTTGSSRPKFTFNCQSAASFTTVVWSNGTTTVGTTNPLTVSPTVNTTYTATMTNSTGCIITTPPVTVAVLALPTAPIATNATQCGTQLSTASVASTTGLPTPIFVWYAAQTGGTALQSSTSTTYLTALSATTTLYVSEFDGFCESVRTPVVFTVTTPPTVAVSASTASFCGTGGATTLTATSSDTGMTFAWTSLNASATLSTTSGAIVNASLTETSDFMVTGTATNATCLPINAYVSIGVYPLPTATVTTTAQGVCPGTSATIGSGLSAGNFTVVCLPAPSGPSPAPLNAVALVGGGAILPLPAGVTVNSTTNLDDNFWGNVPVGFNFNFFGASVTNVFIGTNGTINLGTAGSTTFSFPGGFPNTANPASTVAVAARDLRWDFGGKIQYWTEGYAPNRRFVVQFINGSPFTNSATNLSGVQTAEAVFYETLGTIDIRVIDAKNTTGASLTSDSVIKFIGLQDGTRTIGATAPNCTTTPVTPSFWNGQTAEITSSAPMAWRFSPPSNYSTSWFANGTLIPSATGFANPGTNVFNLSVAPTATTTYSISYTNTVTGCANAAGSAQVLMSVLGNVAPTGVNTISSASPICSYGDTVNLSLSYTGTMDGLTFQWQSSPDGTTWTDIPAITTTTYSVVPTAATQYRCKIVACNGTPAFSIPVSLNFANSVVSTTPNTRCGTGTTTLGATGNTGTTINWYATDTGGSSLGAGTSFVTPSITTNTTFYASAQTFSPGILPVGLGGTNSSNSGQSFFPGFFGGSKTQYIIKADELIAAGIGAGNITSLGFEPTTSGQTYQGFSVSMAPTAATVMTTAFQTTGLSQVYLGTLADNGYIPVANTVNNLAFGTGTGSATSFNWNGSSNILVSISWSSVPASDTAAATTMKVDNVGFVSTAFDLADNLDPATMLASTTADGTTSFRPRFTINGQVVCSSPRVAVVATVTAPPTIALSGNPATICSEQSTAAVTVVTGASDYDTYAWTPAGSVSGTAATGWVFNPLLTTTYSLAVSQSTGVRPCATTTGITVSVNPTPSVLTIAPTPATVCVDTVLPLVATGGIISPNYIATMDALPTDFTLNTANTATVTPNSTYYSQGTGSILFNISSTSSTANYAMNTNLNMTGSPAATLTFSHIVAMEGPTTSFDFGFVEYSIDGGTNWITFSPSDYVGTADASVFTTDARFSTKSYGDWISQFTGTTSDPGVGPATSLWKAETFNIPASALTSTQFRIRFRYTTDISTNFYGWLIDNVKVNKSAPTNIVWSPTTNLYSDAAATTPYTGGNASTVYVKSSTGAATTYTATATSALGCARTATVPVTIYQTLAPTGLQFYQFCPTSGATVNDMSATLVGTAIKWYTVPSGGVALASTTALAQGYYWASQTANGCESPTRFTVFAISNATAAPSSNPLQQFCNSATVANLTANGSGLQWYNASTGGVALASTAPLATGTYYVSQTSGGCESPRTAVAVNVGVVSAPTGPATQSLSSLLTIGDIVVVGSNVVWYSSSANAASGTNPIPASQLLANTTYYATQTVSGCTSTTSLAVTITTLANQDFDMTKFSYYPNPVIDLLNVSYSQDMTNVKVFNMVGQQLLNKEVNATTTQIDMSSYANGAYFIQVSTENAMKTVRVIKK